MRNEAMALLAQGAAKAVDAMLAEQILYAELDLIDVVFGHIKEAADGLRRFAADCDAHVDADVAAANGVRSLSGADIGYSTHSLAVKLR